MPFLRIAVDVVAVLDTGVGVLDGAAAVGVLDGAAVVDVDLPTALFVIGRFAKSLSPTFSPLINPTSSHFSTSFQTFGPSDKAFLSARV